MTAATRRHRTHATPPDAPTGACLLCAVPLAPTPAAPHLATRKGLWCRECVHRNAAGYMLLAYKEARRVRLPAHCDPDEADGWALLALADAARLFDPSRGNQFSTYAVHALRRRLWQYARKEWDRLECERALGVQPGYGDGDGTHGASDFTADPLATAPARGPSPEEEAVRREAPAVVGRLLASLGERERRVLVMRAEGRTLAEVGEAIGTSKERVRQLIVCSIAKVRRTLPEKD